MNLEFPRLFVSAVRAFVPAPPHPPPPPTPIRVMTWNVDRMFSSGQGNAETSGTKEAVALCKNLSGEVVVPVGYESRGANSVSCCGYKCMLVTLKLMEDHALDFVCLQEMMTIDAWESLVENDTIRKKMEEGSVGHVPIMLKEEGGDSNTSDFSVVLYNKARWVMNEHIALFLKTHKSEKNDTNRTHQLVQFKHKRQAALVVDVINMRGFRYTREKEHGDVINRILDWMYRIGLTSDGGHEERPGPEGV
jgi:hypothetical protein